MNVRVKAVEWDVSADPTWKATLSSLGCAQMSEGGTENLGCVVTVTVEGHKNSPGMKRLSTGSPHRPSWDAVVLEVV